MAIPRDKSTLEHLAEYATSTRQRDVMAALIECEGNQVKAAEKAGVSRSSYAMAMEIVA